MMNGPMPQMVSVWVVALSCDADGGAVVFASLSLDNGAIDDDDDYDCDCDGVSRGWQHHHLPRLSHHHHHHWVWSVAFSLLPER